MSTNTLSESERSHRRDFVDFHRRSSAIEAVTPPAAVLDAEEAFVRGDISEDDFLERLRAQIVGSNSEQFRRRDELFDSCSRGEIGIAQLLKRL